MTAEKIKKLTGQKVIVNFKGLQLVGKLLGIAPGFGGRDALIQLPGISQPKKFWATKIEEIK